MPIAVGDVWGSTLGVGLDSGSWGAHKGPNQAGNKSLWGFRSDIGVPGYTGYCPTHLSIKVPHKGFDHTGRPVDSTFKDSITAATVDPGVLQVSEYSQGFRKLPQDTKPFSKTGGGYWFGQRKMTEGKPFIATSIYQDDIVQGAETTRAQLDRTQGLSCTLSGYEAARQQQQQRTQSAPATETASGPLTLRPLGGTQRPPIAVTSVGEAVGYQTTYKSQVLDSPLTGGPAAAGFKKSLSATAAGTASATAEPTRYQTMPRAMPPGMFSDVPSYRIDYGADGSDPLDRSAPGERFQSRLSTTRDLAEGTVRNTNNPPGYTGHTPASRHHELARAHGDAADERMDGKVDMMLYSLDQFSRSRLPKYTGYKPQAPGNITLIQPAQGPTKATTYGSASYQATKNGMPPLDNAHYNNSHAGCMQFFTSTGEFISDNGLTNAQQYYKIVRVGDGRFKGGIPNKATDYGAPFKATNSLV